MCVMIMEERKEECNTEYDDRFFIDLFFVYIVHTEKHEGRKYAHFIRQSRLLCRWLMYAA